MINIKDYKDILVVYKCCKSELYVVIQIIVRLVMLLGEQVTN